MIGLHILLFISLFILSAITCVTIFNFITAPRIAKAPALQSAPLISLLIPARNEAHHIGACLDGLLKQDYRNFEIIVLDDHSDDDTGRIVRQYQEQDGRIRLINGKDLPDGWTGKNWACHQLGEASAGEMLIFTDADNRHAPCAVKNTVSWMHHLKLGLVSAFPQQETRTLPEKLIVPVMDIFVYGTLPLWLTYYAPFSSMAAANGQWIGFTKKAYRQLGGHRSVKNQLVEDTELSRLAKKLKIKTLTTAGTGAVFCRMYHTMKEVWHGFTKNFYGLTGYNNFAFFGIITAMLIAFVLPYAMWPIQRLRMFAVVAISLNLLIRGLIAIKYKHPFWTRVLLHPVAILFAVVIGLNSFFSINRGTITWKGREIIFRRSK